MIQHLELKELKTENYVITIYLKWIKLLVFILSVPLPVNLIGVINYDLGSDKENKDSDL